MWAVDGGGRLRPTPWPPGQRPDPRCAGSWLGVATVKPGTSSMEAEVAAAAKVTAPVVKEDSELTTFDNLCIPSNRFYVRIKL